MNWFQNLRVSRKLLGIFGMMLALVLALGGIALREVGALGSAADDLSGNWLPSVDAARKIQVSLILQRATIYQTVAFDDA
jgi:hypothetical protein